MTNNEKDLSDKSVSQSREIMFRAWNKKGKRIFNVLRLGIGSYKTLLEGKGFEDVGEYNNEDIIIMQYTGLKDKNGVKIYDGDIIKSLDVMGDMYRLDNKGNKHLNGDCGLGQIERLDCGLWYISGQVHNGLKELIDNGHEIEIIGNIYQNPELLSDI